jgi:hypothetical protein
MTVEFEDPRVQAVYAILCDDTMPPNPEEHWEGWKARRIVDALINFPDVPREKIKGVIDGYADSYRRMSGDGTGTVHAASVRADLINNILPQILSLLPEPAPSVVASPTALEPFLTFAKDNVDFDGETYTWKTKCHQERVSDWFGPTDFGLLEQFAGTETASPDAVSALASIAEFCSGDDSKLGAIARLAEVQKVAHDALSRHGKWQGKTVSIEHDVFTGSVIGSYVTHEGKRGVVVQQDGTRVVHVYGEKWLTEKK